MSFQALSWATKQKTECGGSKLLLLMLCNYADDDNKCYPSLSHLATICCCSESSIQRYIKKLVKTNKIKIFKTGKGIRKNNNYVIQCPKNDVVNMTTNTNITNNNKFVRQKGRNKNFIAG
jgi:pyocin large subunit-like protein|tara:strand:- start:586 stop:945 length:360 start_codon:yes stop_codon:yes gene_type:complete